MWRATITLYNAGQEEEDCRAPTVQIEQVSGEKAVGQVHSVDQ